jgi:hypothetical protein
MNCFVDGCDKEANFVPKLIVPGLNDPTKQPFTAILDWPVCNTHVKEMNDRANTFMSGLNERIQLVLESGAKSVTVHDVNKNEARLVFDRDQAAIPDFMNIWVDKLSVNSDEYLEFKGFIKASRPPTFTPPF